MGLISLIKNVAGTTFDSISSQIQDQYLEFFTQDSLGQEILVKKGANKMEQGRNKGYLSPQIRFQENKGLAIQTVWLTVSGKS